MEEHGQDLTAVARRLQPYYVHIGEADEAVMFLAGLYDTYTGGFPELEGGGALQPRPAPHTLWHEQAS